MMETDFVKGHPTIGTSFYLLDELKMDTNALITKA